MAFTGLATPSLLYGEPSGVQAAPSTRRWIWPQLSPAARAAGHAPGFASVKFVVENETGTVSSGMTTVTIAPAAGDVIAMVGSPPPSEVPPSEGPASPAPASVLASALPPSPPPASVLPLPPSPPASVDPASVVASPLVPGPLSATLPELDPELDPELLSSLLHAPTPPTQATPIHRTKVFHLSIVIDSSTIGAECASPTTLPCRQVYRQSLGASARACRRGKAASGSG